MRDLLHHFNYAADSLARTAHLDKVKATAVQEVYVIFNKVSMLYGFLQLYSSNALVSYIKNTFSICHSHWKNQLNRFPFGNFYRKAWHISWLVETKAMEHQIVSILQKRVQNIEMRILHAPTTIQ